MKINKLVIVLSLIFSILISSVVYAADSENTIEVDLSSKSFEELIEDMNADSENMNWDYSSALREIMKTTAEDKIIEAILDENINGELRAIICSHCEDNKLDLDYNKIEHLLFKAALPYNLKINIYYNLIRTGQDDLETMARLVEETDEPITIHAMNRVVKHDIQKAIELSDKIINSIFGPCGDQARAALRAKGTYLRSKDSTQEEWNEFINICDRLLYDDFEDTDDFIQTVETELEYSENKACLEYLFCCDKLEYAYKVQVARRKREIVGDIFGDIDSDKQINATDALNVLQNAAAIKKFDSYQSVVADVNGDYAVNAEDALLILQYSAKIINNFPIFPNME